MRQHKLLFSLLAVFVGLILAVIIFYFYESAHQVNPSQVQKLNILSPTPSNNSMFLTLLEPQDQSVVTNRSVTVSGKTVPGAKIAIITQTSEVAALSASDGSFSTNVTIDNDENILEVDAVSPDGQMAKKRVTITYSTESF